MHTSPRCRHPIAEGAVLIIFGVLLLLPTGLDGSLTDGRRYGQSSPAVAEDEIISMSVGVEVYGGAVEFCLERGMWGAHSERTRILTAQQFEGVETSRIVAGERTDARDNVLVSTWTVPSEAWGVSRSRHHHLHQRAPASSQDGGARSEGLVLIHCHMGDGFELSVYAEYKRVVLGPSLLLPPLHTTNPEARIELFRGIVAHELKDGRAVVDHHMETADAFLSVDQPRRQAAKARHAFEDLLVTLWRSIPGGGAQQQHPHDDAPTHAEELDHVRVLESAVADGLRILIDTSGKHQLAAFWMQLEASLRRRFVFEDVEQVVDDGEEGAHPPSDL